MSLAKTRSSTVKLAERPGTDPLEADRLETVVLISFQHLFDYEMERGFIDVEAFAQKIRRLAKRIKKRGVATGGLSNGKAEKIVKKAITIGQTGNVLTLRGNMCRIDYGICRKVEPLAERMLSDDEREIISEELPHIFSHA